MKVLFKVLLLLLLWSGVVFQVWAEEEECNKSCQIQAFLAKQCKDSYVGERLSRDVQEANTRRSIYNSLLQNGKRATQELKQVATRAKDSKFVQQTVPTFVASHTLGCSGNSCKLPQEKQRRSISLPSTATTAEGAENRNTVNQLHSLLLQSEQRAVSDMNTKQQLLRQCLRRIDSLALGVAAILEIH